MKKTVFLKSTLRQFTRSLLILLFVLAISFAFAARVSEYSLITQETERLRLTYRSVGTLVSAEGSRVISDEVANYMEAAPYVSYTDRRQYTSAVLQGGLYNADNSGNSTTLVMDPDAELIFHLDVFFYGIYTGPEYSSGRGASNDRYEFTIDKVISGYPEYVSEGKSISLCASLDAIGEYASQLKNGERYLLRGEIFKSSFSFDWVPLASDSDWFLPAPTDLDLSQPEYAQLANRIQQSHDNACALDITATADMSTMPFVDPQSGSPILYYLMDGRWLDHEDHLAGNRVIVIHEGLATARGLKIGDSITLDLREAGYIYPQDNQYYAPLYGYQFELLPVGETYQTQSETLEIVGIYNSSNAQAIGTYAYQKAYVPLSVFPESFRPAMSSDVAGDTVPYNFVLDSPEHEADFEEATRNDLAAMGYYVTFLPTGYQNFAAATSGIQTAARSNVIIFAVILAVCFILACFVYFRFRQKDLAISRALGVPVGVCVAGSVLPLVLMGGVGIVAGSALAWSYTQSNAETLLATLVEAAQAEGITATLPMNTLVLLCLALIAALLVLALVFAVLAAKKPVLSQLQGGRNRK